ncbi:hypothetical protein EON68_03455, partial [archaeon]
MLGAAQGDIIPSSPPPGIVVFLLASNESITLDGRLDEPAWQAVPWSDSFADITGDATAPAPYFDTRVKLRYDEHFLYVGAYLQETQVRRRAAARNLC